MRKLLSILLSLAMICGLSCPAFAANETNLQQAPTSENYCSVVYEQIASSTEKVDATISGSMYLYSFNEAPIAIFYNLAPQGYAILDYTNGIVLECSTEVNNPFFVDDSAHYYYNGVFNYYEGTADGQFVNLATGQIVQKDDCLIYEAKDFYCDGELPAATKGEMSEGPVYLEHDTRLYNCNVTDNFSYFYPDLKLSSFSLFRGFVDQLLVLLW